MDGPTPTQRKELLKDHIRAVRSADSEEINVSEIGNHMHGYMSGDIASLVRDAALLALEK